MALLGVALPSLPLIVSTIFAAPAEPVTAQNPQLLLGYAEHSSAVGAQASWDAEVGTLMLRNSPRSAQ